MIDPISGYAPPPWSMLGTVLICRKDRMPITATHFCHLGDFMSHILLLLLLQSLETFALQAV